MLQIGETCVSLLALVSIGQLGAEGLTVGNVGNELLPDPLVLQAPWHVAALHPGPNDINELLDVDRSRTWALA